MHRHLGANRTSTFAIVTVVVVGRLVIMIGAALLNTAWTGTPAAFVLGG